MVEEFAERPTRDPFRARLSEVLARSLGRVDRERLPPALRRAAGFAPAKRAGLVGVRLVEAADGDAALRALLLADLRPSLEEPSDPHDAAVRAWLERGAGWRDVVEAVVGADRARLAREQDRAAADDVDRAARRAEQAAAELREVRRRSRDDLAAVRRDQAEQRHRLGEARARARQLEQQVADLEETLRSERAAAEAAGRARDAEARRLRQRVAGLEQRQARVQGEEREDRDGATVRARLLLDTVIDAAAGLRRELALPAVGASPADRVVADAPGAGDGVSSAAGSLATDDPALLDRLLVVPRTHVIVDGYNVTKSVWDGAPLDVQRHRLVGGLAGLVARTGVEVTVVFDAGEVSGPRPVLAAPRGVRVSFSRPGQIADDLIREYVAAEPEGRAVLVVTSDRAVVRDVVRRTGTRAVGARALVGLLSRA